MPPDPEDLRRIELDTVDLSDLRLPLRATIRVLVVTDTNISIADTPGSFGVGRFIRLLRETTLGCTRFSVDVARRDTVAFSDAGSGGDGHVRYRGFRFDSASGGDQVIDGYHEMFLFGFKPGNDAGPDSDITDPAVFGVVPMEPAESAAVDAWMEAGGGIFATGDHDYLGATMCHRIARVRAMRKWTNADGVPTIGGSTRLDTNQPVTHGQHIGTTMIPISVEEDATPQPIDWVPVETHRHGLFEYRRPHEVLCHPVHGPIDVMPDHPHEGLCFTPAEIEADADRRADFPGSELPQIIAWGQVVPDPPHDHQKGQVPWRRFPMISVYDGWRADRGRIVVDSTWHHWFNMNIDDLESAGGPHWDKISRYFVNVAKWIAPKGAYRSRCWWEVLFAHFQPIAIEEFRRDATDIELGSVLHDRLAHVHGPCTVRDFVFDSICEMFPPICEGLVERFRVPEPLPCLSCPPIDLIERIVLGGMVRGTLDLARDVRKSIEAGEPIRLTIDDVEASARSGAEAAFSEFSADVARSARGIAELFGAAEQAAS